MSGMRKRNINLVIRNKMNAWVASLPESLQDSVRKDVIVTGGCIASLLLGETINDYDVYFKTKETTLAVAEHYVSDFIQNRTDDNKSVGIDIYLEELRDSLGRDRIRIVVKSAGVASEEQTVDYQYFESESENPDAELYVEETKKERKKYRPVFLSSNAITLSDRIQIITRFFGDVEEIHKNFDFVHCMNYWTYADGVILKNASLEALLSKTLIYQGSLYPICSLFRAKKFIQRGWAINAGQYLKMALQISKLDLTSYKILEEQLTGVDAAYFDEVLRKAQNKDDPELVDTAYLTEIINRMF